jgi:hypothetical protein
MATDFQVINKFAGYRAKEDITNLGPNYLVSGSKNVLSNESERIAVRSGFTLDGQANNASNPIESAYDFISSNREERHLRSYEDNLEYRYVDGSGNVTWRLLADGFSSVEFNYTDFWDVASQLRVVLFVNGTPNIFEWNGAITTFASATVNTITKQGTTTWAQDGFYQAGTRQIVIDGITYTYTGGEATTTLTGVTPDPTLGAHAVGAVIHQAIRTTPNSAIVDLPDDFQNALISSLINYVYIGSFSDNQVYISKQNDYKDFSFSIPRGLGEGSVLTLDAFPVGFVQQEDVTYITAGTDQWYQVVLELAADQLRETLVVKRLTTTGQQAAQSQALIAKIKTSVVYVSNEPTLDELGKVENILTAQATNISDPIKNDFDLYDFTGGQVFYFRNFIYISIPRDGVVLLFNLAEGYWEAPQTLPIGRFSVIGGEIYGHSSAVPETYKLFTGVNDNGAPIEAVAAFGYEQYDKRANLKSFNEYYVEGYISSNTILRLTINYNFMGCLGNPSYDIIGSDAQITCQTGGGGSLGKQSLGKFSFAGRGNTQIGDPPPKFRVIKTFPKVDFYEYQPIFSSTGEDQRWELLAFGPSVTMSTAENVSIKQ